MVKKLDIFILLFLFTAFFKHTIWNSNSDVSKRQEFKKLLIQQLFSLNIHFSRECNFKGSSHAWSEIFWTPCMKWDILSQVSHENWCPRDIRHPFGAHWVKLTCLIMLRPKKWSNLEKVISKIPQKKIRDLVN